MRNLLLKIVTLSVFMGVMTNSFPYGTLRAYANESVEQHYSDFGARGVWHRPNSSGRETTLEGLCSVLDEMARAGINMVFLETFYHGMTVFKTNLVPYYTGFEAYDYGEYPDYLTAFTKEAKKRGIEVHAWVESFYLGVNENTSLVKYFPDWLLKNEKGSINHTTEGAELGGYIFFDPANEDVREYLVGFYEELITKVPDISGLNLDYIRYPVSDFYGGTDTGYTKASMTGFAEKYGISVSEGINPQDFKTQIKENSLVEEWTDYRAGQVTDFVRQVFEMVKSRNRECIISVAVHPDISNAYNQKKQDFITWVNNGYIDVVTPMVYYYNANQISYALKEMLASFEGVYCYTGLYTTYHNQSTDELGTHIGASDGSGADGFVLFESAKTFFNPSSDYAGFLYGKYVKDRKLSALPHWSLDRLIKASAQIIAAKLTENGESEESIESFFEEMERISRIGEGSAEKLSAVIDEIVRLRDSKLSDIVSDRSVSDAEATLTVLTEHLEVRRSRLSFKGYTDDIEQPDDDGSNTDKGEGSGEDNVGDADGDEPSVDDGQERSLLDIIKDIIEKIINWFRNLFGTEGAQAS